MPGGGEWGCMHAPTPRVGSAMDVTGCLREERPALRACAQHGMVMRWCQAAKLTATLGTMLGGHCGCPSLLMLLQLACTRLNTPRLLCTRPGSALLHLSELVPAFKDTLTDPEEKLGADIVMKSLRSPARIIAENAGVEGEVIVQKVLGLPFEQVGAMHGVCKGRLARNCIYGTSADPPCNQHGLQSH